MYPSGDPIAHVKAGFANSKSGGDTFRLLLSLLLLFLDNSISLIVEVFDENNGTTTSSTSDASRVAEAAISKFNATVILYKYYM